MGLIKLATGGGLCAGYRCFKISVRYFGFLRRTYICFEIHILYYKRYILLNMSGHTCLTLYDCILLEEGAGFLQYSLHQLLI